MMNWFRMYNEARTDAKIKALSDAEHRIWFNLLCFAAEQETRGVIRGVTSRDTRDNGVTRVTCDYLLAVEVADGDTEALDNAVEKLQKLRIITVTKDGIEFINFKKRQYDKPSDVPEETAKRKARQRSRRKPADIIDFPNQSRDVTPSHAIDTDTDTDTDTEEESPHTPQGAESEHDDAKPDAQERRFEQFWAAYPRKVGKDAAWRKWQQRKPDAALTRVILEAVERHKRSHDWLKDNGQFIPHPSTWLHQGREKDELPGAEMADADDGLTGEQRYARKRLDYLLRGRATGQWDTQSDYPRYNPRTESGRRNWAEEVRRYEDVLGIDDANTAVAS
jgi:hypothetical protein